MAGFMEQLKAELEEADKIEPIEYKKSTMPEYEPVIPQYN